MSDDHRGDRPARAWPAHLAALGVLAAGAAWNAWAWFADARMPPGDFPGYVAEVQHVRDALLAHGRVPRWCATCFAGASDFTSHLKETLVFPLAVVFDPLVATKLGSLALRVAGGFGLYWLAARWFAAPLAGVVAGYALAFGAHANHHAERLELAFAVALLPPLLLAAVAALRRRHALAVVAFGALAAAQLVNNWVYALSVPVAVAGLMLVRPWEGEGDARDAAPWWRRWGVAPVAAALALSLVFAASHLAWTSVDARHHALLSDERIERERDLFVSRSPFLFVNRANALGPWLETHHPPDFELTVWDRGKSYLGVVLLATLVAGGVALRRRPRLRGWAGVALGVAAFSYWLSLGPKTLVWEVLSSFGHGPAAQAAVRAALLVGAAACLAFAVWRGRRRERVAAPLWGAFALAFPCFSLWSAFAPFVPPLQLQRSPGHFFETAPFWLCLAFAAALAALASSRPPRTARALCALVGVAVVVDYAPSRESYREGIRMPRLEQVADTLRELDGRGGSVRLGSAALYDPPLSWLQQQAPTGTGWAWLHWQSGRYWKDFYRAALYGDRVRFAEDGLPQIAPRASLFAAARFRHLLLRPRSTPPRPWRRGADWKLLQLWQLPEIGPYAAGYRAYTARDDAIPPLGLATALERAFAAHRLWIHDAPEGWRDRPGAGPGPEPFPVSMRRPHPERIELAFDAGAEPAVVWLSESHHPWWRATVDGAPAPLLRAQHTFLAVPVPAGARAAVLRFDPPLALDVADWTSRLACAALLLGAPIALWRRRYST